MLPKITITIDGPSAQGIGKTTVAQIIEKVLKEYHYEVVHAVVPALDNPRPLTAGSVLDCTENRRRLVRDNGLYGTSPEHSKPRATINLIETE